jgi:16S rRNA U516 pseudouridylate synthase RsuA-like enzyme
LVRVAIGKLVLGELPKGQWRMLAGQEIDSLSSAHREATLHR